MRNWKWLLAVACLLGAAQFCAAQSFVIDLPDQSQHAIVMQRIGFTNITIDYHRPLVGGRPIWGKLVPYGQPWRAGANQNTTIEFTDAVQVEGQPLAAGTYGVHIIPSESDWIIAFSKQNAAWGSFSYKQDEDALRVTVKPVASDMHEALTYDFDDLKADSTVVTMRWEKLAVPFKVSVNLNDTVPAHLRKELRGLPQYTWESWNDAAGYLAANKIDLDDALKYADTAVQTEARFESYETKSQVLDAMGRKDEAAKAHEQALDRASAAQLYQAARALQRQGKQDDAMAIFRKEVKKYPDEWISHAAAGRLDASEGKYDAALKEMHQALDGAPDPSKPSVQGLIKRLENKEDINK